MAMVVDAFVEVFVEKLCVVIEEEVRMLLGVGKDLATLKDKLLLLEPFLTDAERRKVTDESVRVWLSMLKHVVYDADDLIDDYKLEAERRRRQDPPCSFVSRCVPLLSCFSYLCFRHEIGSRILDINETMEKISRNKPPVLQQEASTGAQPSGGQLDVGTYSMDDEDDLVGIHLEAEDLADRLTQGSSNDKCLIYAIVGMGGIGKTTLARKVYRDGLIDSYFGIKLWVSVPRGAHKIELLKAVIEAAGIKDCGGIQTMALLAEHVQNIVAGKRFLLVLDDVWNESIWENCLKCQLGSGAINSRVLITTRREDVARGMGTFYSHNMKLLPDDESWRLLCNTFRGDSLERVQGELRDIGMEIVRKCEGLPLAIKAVRGVLMRRNSTSEDEWKDVLNSRFWNHEGLPVEVMPALYLSYEDLPLHVKHCFTYCSLFPQDYKFHKLNLVQMWIAEGLVKADGDRTLTDVADGYYTELMDRNLFQAAPDYFEDWGCTMHGLVRELALHVSKHNFIYMVGGDPVDAAGRLRHLTIVGQRDSSVPDIYKLNKCLRTVLLSKNPSIGRLPDDFFDTLRRLRVLDLSYTAIESLNDSVGNLVYLRFLDVSFTKLKELPETIHCLRNLQTLKANGCMFLNRLPDGVARLLNLTHLNVSDTQLNQMPTGIENLKILHTLYGFVTNRENGGGNVKELKELTRLRRLTMHTLETVAGKAEAESAGLKDKMNLRYLRLSVRSHSPSQGVRDAETQKIEEVFEGLFPPPKVESLHIEGFFGRQFPSWITDTSTFSHLRWFRLENCKLCRELPRGRYFSRLRVLDVWSLTSVTYISSEIFSGGAQGGPAPFPLLEELYFWGMTNWKKWARLEDGALPALKKLHIVKCPKLKSLPEGLHHASYLRHLVIEDAGSLKAIKNLPSISELKISNNRELQVLSDLAGLKVMDISNCPSIKETEHLDALCHLRLSGHEMGNLPIWLTETTSLQTLHLTCNVDLLRRCSRDAEDWHIVSLLPRVEARSTDGTKYVSYVKSPHWFKSNLD